MELNMYSYQMFLSAIRRVKKSRFHIFIVVVKEIKYLQLVINIFGICQLACTWKTIIFVSTVFPSPNNELNKHKDPSLKSWQCRIIYIFSKFRNFYSIFNFCFAFIFTVSYCNQPLYATPINRFFNCSVIMNEMRYCMVYH